MLFSTPTQFAVLALLLVAGWLFGLASHPGGRRWKERYAAERDAHAALKRDADTRIADANRRVAELEAERARVVTPAPVVAAPVVAAPVVAHPSALPVARPVYRPRTSRGWFDWNDDPRGRG